jgi:ASC-1-like (ASCH) protein
VDNNIIFILRGIIDEFFDLIHWGSDKAQWKVFMNKQLFLCVPTRGDIIVFYEVVHNLDSIKVKYYEDFQTIKLWGTEHLSKAYVV